jgi:hypothetical protein
LRVLLQASFAQIYKLGSFVQSLTSGVVNFCKSARGLADFMYKYLLIHKQDRHSYIVEKGPNRMLNGGRMEKDATPICSFKIPGEPDPLDFPVTITSDPVSPFRLAASWRMLKEDLQSHGSIVRGIPDVTTDLSPPVEKVLLALFVF